MMNMNYGELVASIVEEVEAMVKAVDLAAVERLTDAVVSAKRVFFAGAGRSRLMLSGTAMRMMHLGLTTHVAGEATTPAITREDLLIVCSGSGETPTVVVMASKAKQVGAKVALITLCEGSTLAETSDVCLVFPRPVKASVQIGAAAFEQAAMLFGDALVCLIAQKLEIADPNRLMGQLHSNLE